MDNDFAILKLAKPVKFTKYVNPICLPEVNSTKNFDYVEAQVSGWGKLGGIMGRLPDILQKVNWVISKSQKYAFSGFMYNSVY